MRLPGGLVGWWRAVRHAPGGCARVRHRRYPFSLRRWRRWHSDRAADAEEDVEEVYQRLTPVEHVLRRPEVYLGSMQAVKRRLWVPPPDALQRLQEGREVRMHAREIEFVPALYKIFDEILVNAADNCRRDATTDRIEVELSGVSGASTTGVANASAHRDHLPAGLSLSTASAPLLISVRNTGRGLPVAMHSQEQMYVPELVFGHLLTGSNFDDRAGRERHTGGRHGYGAKLTNIMSRYFEVETVDSGRALRYRQSWRANMHQRDEPQLQSVSSAERDYTRVRFVPDLERFGVVSGALDADTLALMVRRVFDMAGILPGVTVSLNGTALPIESFAQYAALHGEASADALVVARLNPHWEVGVRVLAPEEFGAPPVSYVNAVATFQGGSHVQYVTESLARRLADGLSAKHKALADVLTPAFVRAHLLLYLNGLVENPTFDSQSKELLTVRAKQVAASLPQPFPPERFARQVLQKAPLVEALLEAAAEKQLAQLRAAKPTTAASVSGVSHGTGALRRLSIPKLEDANAAGGPESSRCTLILTEGDSAKALAMAGLSVVGRDYFGIFPLRGKLLNVRDCHHRQLLSNEEIISVRTILGLQHGRDYATPESRRSLRYGKVMLMTDQDHDGNHIKGLVLNMFDHFWPSLLASGDFLEQFITPIVKATWRGRSSRAPAEPVRAFYRLPDFQQWWHALDAQSATQWHIKYYKGLGTSTSQEGREYFRQLERHRVRFAACTSSDRNRIDMAFNKERAEERRLWLSEARVRGSETVVDAEAAVPEVPLPHAERPAVAVTQSVSHFIDRELVQFSHASNARSIPSVVDGLKPSQRKVLYACFKRDLRQEMKVAQLAGYVAEHTAYHHGEMSLYSTIIHMAQDFWGANNVPLLQPIGQFGTRLQGGRDCASARYIFTCLSPLARSIYPARDDPLLQYCVDDGQCVEPETYVPVLPMVLVNGVDGVGTGWSTAIPAYHPLRVLENVERLLHGQPPQPLTPWSRHFRGSVRPGRGPQQFVTHGVVQRASSTTFRVSELPLGRWTEDYKAFLIELTDTGLLKGFREHHTDDAVCFELVLTRANAARLERASQGYAGLLRRFRLESSMSCGNMHMFDAQGRIRKYEHPLAVYDDFMPVRLQLYERRRERELQQLQLRWQAAENRARFIDLVCRREVELVGRSIAQVMRDMERCGVTRMCEADGDDGYEELLSMPLRNLTREQGERATQEAQRLHAQWQALQHLSAKEMWAVELEALRKQILSRWKSSEKPKPVEEDAEET